MLQLRRIRESHSGQVYVGSATETLPQLQERGPSDRRLSDENRNENRGNRETKRFGVERHRDRNSRRDL